MASRASAATTTVRGAGTTREAILRAAARLFAQKGFAGTSTRDIAAGVGITQPALYRHFETKHAIFLALVATFVDPWVRVAAKLRNDPAPPSVRLAALFGRMCNDLVDSPYETGPMLFDPALSDPEMQVAERSFRRVVRVLTALIAEGVAAGEVRDLDAQVATATFLGLLDPIIGAAPRVRSRIASNAIDFALRGLLLDPSRADEVRRQAAEVAGESTGGLLSRVVD